MKSKKLQYILPLLAVSLLWSCKKELDVYPTTQEVDGNVIVDTKSASTVLNGVYYRFAYGGEDYNSVPSIEWTDVNEILPSELCGSLNNSSGDDGIYSLTATPSSYGVTNLWSYGYNIVNAANGFIKNVTSVTTIPTATKNQMIAEAKFLRAFADAELLLYFGQYYDTSSKYGIILRDEFVTSNNISLPRSTVAQSYASIIADLEAAIPNLPKTNTEAYFANASAAKLLEARVLINRAASGDLAKVVSLTTDVIQNGGFSLESSEQDIFWTKGFSSSEVIMGVQPYATQTYKFNDDQYYGQYTASPTFVTLLTGDPRNTWVYKDDQGGTIYGEYYGDVNEITKFYSGSVTSPAETSLAENCYAFRLSEAYLLRAEANAAQATNLNDAQNGPAADLTLVESKAGYADPAVAANAQNATALLALVQKEEIKNFFSENGADWFALRRLDLNDAKLIQPAFATISQHYIFPIPQTEINLNNQVIQNP